MPEKDSEHTSAAITISEEAQNEAKALVEKTFDLFAQHTKRLADDLAEFNLKNQEVQERIGRGARRTSGRVI